MLAFLIANASAYSCTIELETLRQMRDDVPDLPVCARMEIQGIVTELLSTMDGVIAVLEQWSNGEIGHTASE